MDVRDPHSDSARNAGELEVPTEASCCISASEISGQAREMKTTAVRWCGSTALAVLLTAVVAIPLWCVLYPPLYDYPFHLARLLVLHDIWNAGPLSKYYQINSF